MDENGASTPPGAHGEDERHEASCCAGTLQGVEPREALAADGRGGAGRWFAIGAVLAAVLSSACCWLPLLLIGFGVSAAGIAGTFERYRPLLLGLTGVLLAGGFYLTCRRRPACAPGQACASGHQRLRRVQKASLWIATLLVGAFALFPRYVGALLASSTDASASAADDNAPTREVAIRVRGMTCEGCASGIATRLRGVPGVVRAEVDFESGRARAWLRPDGDPAALLEAIEQLGYGGEPEASAPRSPRPDAAARGG